MRIALFPTCVVDALAPDVGMATAHLLERAGHDVVVPEAATCCGQPAWNVGHASPAAQVAETTLRALADAEAEAIVVPAGSCATMMRVFWAELFELEGTEDQRRLASQVTARIRELSEFLIADADPRAADAGSATDESVHGSVDEIPTVYHRSCHMLRELRITDEPERLLDAAGITRRRSRARDRCCGFGGMFSVKLPEASVAMADDVLDAALDAGAERIVGCDSSCMLHLRSRARRRELPLEFLHLAEMLERSSDPDRGDRTDRR